MFYLLRLCHSSGAPDYRQREKIQSRDLGRQKPLGVPLSVLGVVVNEQCPRASDRNRAEEWGKGRSHA